MKKKPSKKTPVVPAKPQGVQVHFGNVKIMEIKLLEAIAKNTLEIARLLRDVKEEK